MQGSGSVPIRQPFIARIFWMSLVLMAFSGTMETNSTPLADKEAASVTPSAAIREKSEVLSPGKESNMDIDLARNEAGASVAQTAEPERKPSEDSAESVFEHVQRITAEPFPYLDMKQFEKVEVVATGYSADKESTGKSPGHPEYGITRSGVRVRKDTFSTIAADPAVFPLGTILFIPDYGFGVVADTGSAIKGYKLDLYFHTRAQVYQEWGKRKVHVYVLRRGDGKVTEVMMDRLNSMKAVPVNKDSYM